MVCLLHDAVTPYDLAGSSPKTGRAAVMKELRELFGVHQGRASRDLAEQKFGRVPPTHCSGILLEPRRPTKAERGYLCETMRS